MAAPPHFQGPPAFAGPPAGAEPLGEGPPLAGRQTAPAPAAAAGPEGDAQPAPGERAPSPAAATFAGQPAAREPAAGCCTRRDGRGGPDLEACPPTEGTPDLAEAVLGGLRLVPASQRGRECARRRALLREALARLDEDLAETGAAIGLRPHKSDRLTARAYHDCFRRLHLVLDHCLRIQELASTLEDYDSLRLVDASVCSDYGALGIDIVSRHDRAQLLLHELCVECGEEPGNDKVQTHWLLDALAACSTRQRTLSMRSGAAATTAGGDPPPKPG